MAERTCTNCGATVPDGARFCTSCGTEAPQASAPEPYTEPVAPTTELPPSEPPAPAWAPPPAAPPPQPQQPEQAQSWSVPPPAQAPPTQAPPTQAPTSPPSWQQPQQPAPAWQQPQQPGWGAQPAAYGAAAAPAPAKKKGNVLGGLLAFVGAILLVAGAFTQWLRTNIETYTGWDVSVDGKVVVGLAVVAVIVGLMLIAGVRSIVLRLALLALGVWALVIAIVDIVDVGNQLDSLEPAIGIGLVLVAIAGGVLLLAGLVTRSRA